MSTPSRPAPTAGLRHVALFVTDLEACEDFYTRLVGMEVEWRPDPDNCYLCGGNDNLALHRSTQPPSGEGQRLDHFGFIIDRIEDVDPWHEWLASQGVEILAPPKTHRDGARSFYCSDPAGNVVQFIFHPPISAGG